MLAVIETGGKQHLVSPGQKIKIDPHYQKISAGARKLAKEEEEIVFGEVLLLQKGKKIEIGNPLVKGAKVTAKVLSHGKGKKVIVFKYKPKTRYKRKRGYRQPFTEVEIKAIILE